MDHARALAGLLALSACASPEPKLYTLPSCAAAHAVAPRRLQPGTILLRAVELPRYLHREQIVHSQGPDRLVAAQNDWWGEPLPAAVERVLAADLAARLPEARITTGSSPIAEQQPDVTLTIDLQHFEADDSGSVILDGQSAIRRAGKTSLIPLRVTQEVVGRGDAGRVAAMGEALCAASGLLEAPLVTPSAGLQW